MKEKRNRKKVKDTELKIRISSFKKQKIKEYCKKNNISMTKFIDIAIDNILNED